VSQVVTKETKEFQAETKQLLDLMIHSIYINKEIFLRELISNASDAIDKVRFQALTDQNLLGDDKDFQIYLTIDAQAKTLTIADNGIGMTYADVVENIGTIAKSGTKAFLENLGKEKASTSNLELIGQFGIGFYSAFMVAHKIVLITKAPGAEKAVKWESTGDGTYTIEEIECINRGTTITLYLQDEFTSSESSNENFLDPYTIQNLVQKYSDYVRFPIKLDFPKIEKDEKKEEKESAKTPELETKTLNSMTPLWVRQKKDISADEYHQFYKNMFHDWNDPAEIIHTHGEGVVEYSALLFIPEKAPFDFYSRDFQPGIKLYSKGVFIMENCTDVLPDYLKFVRGLVDSSDFSLNISREVLQQSRQLQAIGKNLEKNILKTMETLLKNDRKKYEALWSEFGKAIKGGIYFDRVNKDKLQDLLVFASTKTTEGQTTLAEYISRMPETQTEIFYVVTKDAAAAAKIPQMEIFRDKGIEVLYLMDKVDEFMIDTLHEYQGKKLKSISRGDIDLTKEDKDAEKPETDKVKEEGLLKTIKDALGDKIADVKLSQRLKSSAVCLVSSDSGISLAMEQLLAENDQMMFKAKRILEINPQHQVFATLQKIYDQDPNSQMLKEYSQLLYGQALLLEGISLEDPKNFVDKVSELMAGAFKG
jgi:molecular chaperone HtpG